jgi:SAM-dependent methyltransferase
VGIDVSADIAGVARERHRGLRCVRADVRALPFKAGSFDVVLSNSTLDHFAARRDIDRSLRELARVLTPGGLMIVSLDNLANPIIALRAALPLPLLRCLRIVPYFVGATLGPRGLRRALTDAGLEVRDLTAIVHFPRVLLVAIDRLAGRRLGARGARRLLRTARWFDRMGRLPTRFVSGHFVAARALKR